MGKTIELNEANFEQYIMGEQPVLVDFWAEWCGPCRMVAPLVEELAAEYEGKAIVGKVNVDFNPNLSIKYGIKSIPALMVFKNGVVVDKVIGVTPKNVLSQKINAQLV